MVTNVTILANFINTRIKYRVDIKAYPNYIFYNMNHKRYWQEKFFLSYSHLASRAGVLCSSMHKSRWINKISLLKSYFLYFLHFKNFIVGFSFVYFTPKVSLVSKVSLVEFVKGKLWDDQKCLYNICFVSGHVICAVLRNLLGKQDLSNYPRQHYRRF